MQIDNFLNLIEKQIVNIESNILKYVIAQFDKQNKENLEEEILEEERLLNIEALQLLQQLKLYEKQQQYESPSFIRALRQHEKELRHRQADNSVQSSLMSYFK